MSLYLCLCVCVCVRPPGFARVVCVEEGVVPVGAPLELGRYIVIRTLVTASHPSLEHFKAFLLKQESFTTRNEIQWEAAMAIAGQNTHTHTHTRTHRVSLRADRVSPPLISVCVSLRVFVVVCYFCCCFCSECVLQLSQRFRSSETIVRSFEHITWVWAASGW